MRSPIKQSAGGRTGRGTTAIEYRRMCASNYQGRETMTADMGVEVSHAWDNCP